MLSSHNNSDQAIIHRQTRYCPVALVPFRKWFGTGQNYSSTQWRVGPQVMSNPASNSCNSGLGAFTSRQMQY